MEFWFSLMVLAFAAYGAYRVWYVPRQQSKSGSRPADPIDRDRL